MTTRKTILSRTNGMVEVLHFDDNNGGENLHTTTHYDNRRLLEKVRFIRDAANWALTKPEPLRHAACVPPHEYDRACREGWVNDMSKWDEWADLPENAQWRTWPGKLSRKIIKPVDNG